MLVPWIASCATGTSSQLSLVVASCPPLKAYSKEFLIKVADQLAEVRQAHGDEAALQILVTDYAVTRDMIRACLSRAKTGGRNADR